ncbi:MAG: GDSL-type esterase/lipase family protein [Lachnospiraceae bacterium]|jgi:lysophospholipase L1-like esterase
MKRILCFGDSNTWGYDGTTGGRFDRSVRWTGRLAQLLGSGYEIIEDGQCGRTLICESPYYGPSGCQSIEAAINRAAPVDILIVQLGSNDLDIPYGLSASDIAAGLGIFVRKARAAAGWRTDLPEILVIVPRPIPKEAEQPSNPFFYEKGRISSKSERLACRMQETAELSACESLDLDESYSVNSIDFMHLTPEGHRRLAEKLAEIILR